MKRLLALFAAILVVTGYILFQSFPKSESTIQRAAFTSTLEEVRADGAPLLLAALAERAAERGLGAETSSLARETFAALNAEGHATRSAEIFYICIRMARIDSLNLVEERFLGTCLNIADEFIHQDISDLSDSSFWPYLHIRLAQELGELGFLSEQARVTEFAAMQVWPQFTGDQRAAYGRIFVPHLSEVMGETWGEDYCRQTFGAALIGVKNAAYATPALMIPGHNCFGSLPDGLRTDLYQSFAQIALAIQEDGVRTPSLDLLLMVAAHQAYYGLHDPLPWGSIGSLVEGSGCSENSVAACLALYVLGQAQTQNVEASDLVWATQLMGLALVVSNEAQIDQIEEIVHNAHLQTLVSPQSQVQFNDADYTAEMVVQASMATLEATWGQRDRAASRFESIAPLRGAALFYLLNDVLEVAELLLEDVGAERAVQFLDGVLDTEDGLAVLFQADAEGTGLAVADYIRLAKFYNRADEAGRAQALLSSAVRVAQSPDALLSLGQVLMLLGLEDEASTAFEQALQAANTGDSNTVTVFDSLAQVRAVIAVSQLTPISSLKELPPFLGAMTDDAGTPSALVPY